ncbi:MAG: response regulator transcription factor [Thermoanaerobaculia bacterium]|nr:response regulator transcription factor [Thermoanaerobaculia bacterium]
MESTRTVAIVDDEENIRDTVAFALEREGCQVETFADGEEAWSRFQRTLPDLAILDILMPRMDGLELCRRLRSESEALPIIFLTSRDEEFDRVLGLELGADDYLCKPFSMRELVARVKVLFRRLSLQQEPESEGAERPLVVGPLELDLQRYLVRWRGKSVDLTVTEIRVLEALVRHPEHVKSRRQLTDEAYPFDTYVSERTIDSHVKRIRRKFEKVDPDFDSIESIYGAGYRYRPTEDDRND